MSTCQKSSPVVSSDLGVAVEFDTLCFYGIYRIARVMPASAAMLSAIFCMIYGDTTLFDVQKV